MRSQLKSEPYEVILLKRMESYTTRVYGHWLFTHSVLPNGYAQIHAFGKRDYVHRVAMHLYRGFSLDTKLYVGHRRGCDHRNCWNPDHLVVQDSPRSNVPYKTHCIRGHAFVEGNIYWYRGNRWCMECRRIRTRVYHKV